MKKNTRGARGRRLSMLFGLMIGVGIFFGGGEARADTFNVTVYDNGQAYMYGKNYIATFTAGLNKSQYTPRETVIATGTAVFSECSNHLYLDWDGNDGMTLKATINGATASVEGVSAPFTAQNSPGRYNALFTGYLHIGFGTDESGVPYPLASATDSINIPYTVASAPLPTPTPTSAPTPTPIPTPTPPSKILKICPPTATIAQGSSQVLGLYYDMRVAGDCSGAGTPALTGSWSETSPYISISPLSGNTTTVRAVNTGDTVTHSGNTVTATYAGKTATANVTVAAVLPACSCDPAIASTKCSTTVFPGTPPPTPCTQSTCYGTRDCSGTWKEVPPTN